MTDEQDLVMIYHEAVFYAVREARNRGVDPNHIDARNTPKILKALEVPYDLWNRVPVFAVSDLLHALERRGQDIESLFSEMEKDLDSYPTVTELHNTPQTSLGDF